MVFLHSVLGNSFSDWIPARHVFWRALDAIISRVRKRREEFIASSCNYWSHRNRCIYGRYVGVFWIYLFPTACVAIQAKTTTKIREAFVNNGQPDVFSTPTSESIPPPPPRLPAQSDSPAPQTGWSQFQSHRSACLQ